MEAPGILQPGHSDTERLTVKRRRANVNRWRGKSSEMRSTDIEPNKAPKPESEPDFQCAGLPAAMPQ